MIAGLGDLTFDLWGYVLAIGSALSTAAYVVIVGKLGDELQFDSWMLLFYNCLWSLPLSILLVVGTGEATRLFVYQGLTSVSFLLVRGYSPDFPCHRPRNRCVIESC